MLSTEKKSIFEAYDLGNIRTDRHKDKKYNGEVIALTKIRNQNLRLFWLPHYLDIID